MVARPAHRVVAPEVERLRQGRVVLDCCGRVRAQAPDRRRRRLHDPRPGCRRGHAPGAEHEPDAGAGASWCTSTCMLGDAADQAAEVERLVALGETVVDWDLDRRPRLRGPRRHRGQPLLRHRRRAEARAVADWSLVDGIEAKVGDAHQGFPQPSVHGPMSVQHFVDERGRYDGKTLQEGCGCWWSTRSGTGRRPGRGDPVRPGGRGEDGPTRIQPPGRVRRTSSRRRSC